MQKFFIHIDATSSDGEIVKCNTEISLSCGNSMATNVVAKTFIDNPILKDIFTQALLICASGLVNTEEITSEIYDKPSDEDTTPEF